jgi:Rrf2 family transcriptional regulator, iron-sulfur cluster assembly transcription factor
MKINTDIRYALRAMCDIVYNSAGNPAQVREIAERQRISPRYIEQIFQKLKKGGLLRSMRGPIGGYFLSRKPEDITIGDVIRAVDGKNVSLVSCAAERKRKNGGCEKLGACVISEIWDEASRKLTEYFDSVNIKQICGEARKRNLDM